MRGFCRQCRKIYALNRDGMLRRHHAGADQPCPGSNTTPVTHPASWGTTPGPSADARPDWDAYGLSLATVVAARADCTRRQVGAVILDAGHRVLAAGYNGAPPGMPGCRSAGACPRGRLDPGTLAHGAGDYDHCIAVHAEANALLYADPVRRDGATLYCTDEPCPGCWKLIAAGGIALVVWPRGRVETARVAA